MDIRKKITATSADPAIILIRLMVGVVFLSEGIQKFLFPAERGAGRLEKIGFSSPDFWGAFLGTMETVCGACILLGLFTRLAAIPTFIIMVVAIASTKIGIGVEEGFWSMMHAARTDWAMLLGSLFLIIKGGGNWSLDQVLFPGGFQGR